MKRWWFGVMLVMWAGLAAVFAFAPVAHAAIPPGCPGSNSDAGPTINATCPDGSYIVNGQHLSAAQVAAQPHCDVGSMTWLLCPAISVAQGAIQTLEGWAQSQLSFAPLTTSNPIYALWVAFRDLADVFFILVFFVVIFGTSVGLDNYTVKKTLPRLVAAAILVQFSYALAGLLVDVTNVLGAGINAIAAGLPTSQQGHHVDVNFLNILGSLTTLGVVTTVTIVTGVVPVIITVISAVIGLLTAFAVLELRSILLDFLIVIGPLAFCLWVLPTTEKYFRWWWEFFTKLLLMYPIIILLFVVANLFSSIVPAADATTDPTDKVFRGLMASLAPIIAFFLVPETFKLAGSALTRGAGFIGGVTGQHTRLTDKWRDSSEETRKEKAALAHNKYLALGDQGGIKNAMTGAKDRIARTRMTGNPFTAFTGRTKASTGNLRLASTADKAVEEKATAAGMFEMINGVKLKDAGLNLTPENRSALVKKITDSHRSGDEGTMVAAMRSLGQTQGGRQALRELRTTAEFGGNNNQVVAAQHLDSWNKGMSDLPSGAAPDLTATLGNAYSQASASDLASLDPQSAEAAFAYWRTADAATQDRAKGAVGNLAQAATLLGRTDRETAKTIFREAQQTPAAEPGQSWASLNPDLNKLNDPTWKPPEAPKEPTTTAPPPPSSPDDEDIPGPPDDDNDTP